MRIRHHFLLSLAVLACACTGSKDSDGQQAELSWGTASLCINEPIASGDSLCYQIKLKLDTLAGESTLAKTLSQVLRDSVICMPDLPTIQAAMASFADSTKAEWQAELAERYEPESDFNEILQYYFTLEGSAVNTGRDDVLSYMTTTDCYLGGAHGSYVVNYYNFDIQSGKLLGISDVVPADKEMLVMKAMEEQLCEDWEAKDLDDLKETTGITCLGDLYLTNNFLLEGDSIVFLFNQYEIAPYAAGLISVTLPRP